MGGIADFLANLKGGGARPNRFEVMIEFPAAVAGADVIRKTAFLVNSSQLPGSTIGVIEQPFRGRQVKLAGDRTFDEWECTFVNDSDFSIRNAMEAWHNLINSYRTNQGTTPETYMSTVTAYQLDQNDNRIKTYRMLYAFPSMVAPIEVAQDSNDVLEMFSTTFVYSDIDNGQAT